MLKRKEPSSINEFFTEVVWKPISKVVFYGASATYHQSIHNLAELEARRSVMIPIYEFDDEYSGEDYRLKIVGYRPVSAQECKENISASISAANNSATSLVLAEAKVLDRADEVLANFDKYIRSFTGKEYSAEEIPTSFFLKMDTIPEYLHDDAVFSLYLCALTGKPIRHLLVDPKTGNHYESAAIKERLKTNPTCPTTQGVLHLHDLHPSLAEQTLINSRLAKHDKLFADYVAKRKDMKNVLEHPQPLREDSELIDVDNYY